ncbi:MAG: cytochrome c oxidase assembly protein [Gammaproteobacteria bacterium]|nr:cytochrome c oxidase assembly protein [Gammaproteobacteria bacterium]
MAAKNPVRKTILWSLLAGVAMFGFAMFVMPPLYNVFCEVTGLGGKPGGRYVAEQPVVDLERVVKVQFVTTNNSAMPWEFRPLTDSVRVHPGESHRVEFYARNDTARDMIAQAIPSIAPENAAKHLHKTQCFCFDQQPLKAGAEANMPVVFFIDPALPPSINTVTLSYTLFDVTDRQSAEVTARN